MGRPIAHLFICLLGLGISEAGFVSPGHSVYVEASPTLKYLLKCGLIPLKEPILSTYDIYTLDELSQGLKQLQMKLGLKVTGKEGSEERKVVSSGECATILPPPSNVEFLPPSSPSVDTPEAPSAPYVQYKENEKNILEENDPVKKLFEHKDPATNPLLVPEPVKFPLEFSEPLKKPSISGKKPFYVMKTFPLEAGKDAIVINTQAVEDAITFPTKVGKDVMTSTSSLKLQFSNSLFPSNQPSPSFPPLPASTAFPRAVPSPYTLERGKVVSALKAMEPCSSSFLSTWEGGQTTMMKCPPGTVFSGEKKECTWAASLKNCQT